MLRKYIFTLLFFSYPVLASDLPNELFDIQLMSNISALKGEANKGKGVVRIKGVAYRYYSADENHYRTNGKFESIIVQAREDTGIITSIIGETKIAKDECLEAIDKYHDEVEKQFSIKFSERNNNPYYLLAEGNKVLMLACELKRNSSYKIILAEMRE